VSPFALGRRVITRSADPDDARCHPTRRFVCVTQSILAFALVFGVDTRKRRIIWPDGIAAGVGGLFGDVEAARQLGRHYLATHPDEANVATLATLLYSEGSGWWPPDGPAVLRAGIAARRKADFSAGRVVQVDGWVLTSTEARACALAALT
jgi:hypothetical protein